MLGINYKAMNKQFLLASKKLTRKLIIAGISILFITNTAFAYNAPKNPSRPKTTNSNATRNNICVQNAESNLSVLAPVGHIGQSISQQPIFAWFLPNTQQTRMRFSIFEYANNARGQKIKSFEVVAQPGKIMKFSPPPEEFTFEVGKTYVWQISLLCDRNNPINNIFAEAVVEIVPKSPALVSQISQATNPLKRAQIYADSGLWYDALSEVLENSQGQVFRSQMLNILSKLEAQSASEIPDKDSNLKKYLTIQALELDRLSQFQDKLDN
jgi:hypothetical protein